MNAREGAPTPSDGDRVPGWWMDGDAEAQMRRGSSAVAIGPPLYVDDRERERWASHQLVHAILLHFGKGEPASRKARLERAIQAVRESTEGLSEPQFVRPKSTARPRVRSLVRWSVATSLLVALGVWLSTLPSSAALASLDRVVQAMDNQVDRTYEITVDGGDARVNEPPREPGPKPPRRDPDDRRPPPNDRPPPPDDRPLPPPDDRTPPAPDRRPGLGGAILYARSGRQFVLFRAAPGGKTVINGSNGVENWLIRPEKAVLLSSDPGEFRIPMPENLAAIPLVDLRSSLVDLRRGYRLEDLPAQTLDDGTMTLWHRLRARRLDAATKGPETVWLWYHPTTNLLGRIEFDGIYLQGRLEPQRMTIRLVSTASLPDNWFEHSAHHAANTPIERVAP